MTRVFVTGRPPGRAIEMLEEAFEVRCWSGDGPIPRAALLAGVADADGLYSLLGGDIDTEVLDAAPRLRVVSQMAVGVDNIDLDACRDRGVAVGNTPDVLTDATADTAVALLLAGSRRLSEGIDHVRSGAWKAWELDRFVGSEVSGSTVGIVGGGRIGSAVARRMLGFGCRVLVAGRPGGSVPAIEGAEVATLDDLLGRADHVVLTVPLTADTRHLIDDDALARMRPTAGLVNVARGAVVDTDALVRALDAERLAYVALDVTDPEPIPASHPLVGQRRCTIIPHVGSATHRTRAAMGELAAANLIAGLTGAPMPARVV